MPRAVMTACFAVLAAALGSWGAASLGRADAPTARGSAAGSAALPAAASTLAAAAQEEAPAAKRIALRPNPLVGLNAAAPEELAYDPPTHQITQLGMGRVKFWSVLSPTLDKSRLMTPWVLTVDGERRNDVEFTYPNGATIKRHDLRRLPPNRWGLPDFGKGPFADEFAAGRAKIDSLAFASVSEDPDWRRWIAGTYEVVLEHEAGASLGERVRAVDERATVSEPVVERLPNGFVRRTYEISAPRGAAFLGLVIGHNEPATARRWRRLSIYHTEAFETRRGGGLTPTGERALHEAGRIWSPRFLRLWADRYDAVRFLDVLDQNAVAEERYSERSDLSKQGTWSLTTQALPHFHFPHREHMKLNGAYGGGVPYEAAMRMAYEASLVAREAGRSGHVVNPHTFLPQRAEGEEVDRYLGAIARHVAWAERNGVAYQHVKLAVGNEIWNFAGGFREDHAYFAAMPSSWVGREEAEPWYIDRETLDGYNGVASEAAMKAAARRMIHVLSRAHALYPEVNWIGEYSGQTGNTRTVPWVMAGARDGAADVAKWARRGDPWTGSQDYAVIPKDEEGRPKVGALFTYAMTGYRSHRGGPRNRQFAGMTENQVRTRAEDGTLAAFVLQRFLKLPARPARPDQDSYQYWASLQGIRQAYRDAAAALAREGGAMMDMYEGGDHTLEDDQWPPEVKDAFRAWKKSPEHARAARAVYEMAAEEGLIGISDFGFAKRDEKNNREVKSAPWAEIGDPYALGPHGSLTAPGATPLSR